MGVKTLDREKYGQLCADTLPKVIENDREFDRMAASLEELTFKKNSTPEERALAKLLERLILDYDDEHHPIPDQAPHEILRFLMDQRGLRQRDLIPVLGASSTASDVVNGKRAISKAQARKLAEFFHVPADLFI